MNTESSKLARAETHLEKMRKEFRARETDYFRKSRVASATKACAVFINSLDAVLSVITIPPICSRALVALQGGQAVDLSWAKSAMEQAKSKMDAADAEVRGFGGSARVNMVMEEAKSNLDAADHEVRGWHGAARVNKLWGLGCIILVLALVTLTNIIIRNVAGHEMSQLETKWLIRAATIALSGSLWFVYGLAKWRVLLLSALGVLMAARWNPGRIGVEELVAVLVSFWIVFM